MNPAYNDICNRLDDIQSRINAFEDEDDCDYGSKYYQDLLEDEAALLAELDELDEEGS
jgi:hypothetical protein